MIYFIGAGPGAPDLITVRGMRLLQKADVVIYAGSLVNPELLDYCRPETIVYNSASMTLEETVAAMQSAPEGATVVRLHTGDPCLYGAIAEQMRELDRLGLAYEVVPGVSSFCGAAAAIPAEYTPAEVSQTVIITRMAGRTPVPERENLRTLAAHRASMVLFLSVSMIARVCSELIAGGYPETTPVAVVYKATWPEQEVVRGVLSNIAGKVSHIHKTALILVGDFLRESDKRSKLYDPTFTHACREAKKS